jgi:hypothetical protein
MTLQPLTHFNPIAATFDAAGLRKAPNPADEARSPGRTNFDRTGIGGRRPSRLGPRQGSFPGNTKPLRGKEERHIIVAHSMDSPANAIATAQLHGLRW